MLIRSQDITQLVNVDLVGNIKVDDNIILAVFTNEKYDYVILGKYSTHEQALKVLEWIGQAYLNCNEIQMNHNQGISTVSRAFVRNYIYPMPQDEGVIV